MTPLLPPTPPEIPGFILWAAILSAIAFFAVLASIILDAVRSWCRTWPNARRRPGKRYGTRTTVHTFASDRLDPP